MHDDDTPSIVCAAQRYRQDLESIRGGQGGKVVGVSEEELVKLQDDADRREKQLKHQVTSLGDFFGRWEVIHLWEVITLGGRR